MNKHVLLLIVVILLSGSIAKAQFFRVEDLPRNDFSLGVGFAFISVDEHRARKVAINKSVSPYGKNGRLEMKPMYDSFNFFYVRNLFNRWGVGIQANYYCDEGEGTDITSKFYYHKLFSIKESGVTVMPTVRCSWWNHHHLGLYTRLACGLDFHKVELTDFNVHDDVDIETGTISSTNLAYQISLVGIEAGGHRIRGFIELGHGYQGNVTFGARLKLGYK